MRPATPSVQRRRGGRPELIDGPEGGVLLSAEQVANIDSKDMDFAWQALAQRCAHWLA